MSLPPSLPSWSPFMVSLLGCWSWLPLPPCPPACFPSWFRFRAALGCRCHLVSQLVSLHGSWLPLPPCLPSLSPSLIALLPENSQACLPSWFPFWASPGYSCRPVSQASLPPPWFPFWAALGYSRLCLPPSFRAAVGSYCRAFPFLAVFSPLWSYIFGFYVCILLATSPVLSSMCS